MPDQPDLSCCLLRQHGADQGVDYARSGGIAAGMEDARRGMGGLQAEGGPAVVVLVKMNTKPHQAGDVVARLGAEHADGLVVAVPGTRGEGVGDVGSHGVARRGFVQHGRDPALRVERVAVRERALGQHHHIGARLRRQEGGVQAGYAASDDDQPLGGCAAVSSGTGLSDGWDGGHYGLAASMRSSAVLAFACTASATVMRLTTRPATSSSSTQAR